MQNIKHKTQGYVHHQLEVLEGNFKAEKAYVKAGFCHSRDVVGYKGLITVRPDTDINIIETKSLDWEIAQSFWDVQPAYQNHTNTVIRGMKRQKIVIALINGNLAGYAVYDFKNGRIKQFAVNHEYRCRGVGKTLFSHVCSKVGETHFINYEANDTGTAAFFKCIGLAPTYRLHEMTLIYS